MQNLDELRDRIDTIDDEILSLLNKRMEFVKSIGELKNKNKTPIYRPEREKAIISRLVEQKHINLDKKAIEAIFYEIFSVSRNLEKAQNVAFLGPIGTHTHQAAKSRFGAISSYLPLSNIKSVFNALLNKEAKYGVVPIENNTEGVVGATLDCLKDNFEYIKIVGEIYMDIHHCFLSLNSDLKMIEKIYSHPQAYNQCKDFIEEHNLFDIAFIPTKSTAQATKFASSDPKSAAIASFISGEIYNVPVLFEKIEDNKFNRTRFFILSDYKNEKTQNNKTSILAKTDHKPGGLVELLSMFRNYGINLTRLESRPMKNKDFKTLFYIDFIGHIDDECVQDVLHLASKNGHEISWLGSYINGDLQ